MSDKEMKKAKDGILKLADFVEEAAGPFAMNDYRKMWLDILEDARKAHDPRYKRCNRCNELSNNTEETEESFDEGGSYLRILCYICRN